MRAAAAARATITATVLLLVAAVAPLWWCERTLVPASRWSTPDSKQAIIKPDVLDRLVARLDTQQQQRTAWAYAALAAIVAVSVVKRVFPIPWIKPAFLSLAVAAAFLCESIRAGEIYQQRIAYLILNGEVRTSDLTGVSNVLWLQIAFLNHAFMTLLIFVGLFMIAVLAGKLSLSEARR